MKWRSWVRTLLVGFGLFAYATSAMAGTVVADPTMTSFSVDSISSTTKAATGVSITFDFVTSATISAGTGFQIEAQSVDCQTDWANCQMNFDNAALSGITGSLNNTGGTTLNFSNTNSMPAGTYSVTVSGVTNMNYDGAVRFYIRTDESDTSGIDSNARIGTYTSPVIIGSPLAQGTIADGDGAPVELWGEVYNEDWSLQKGFNSDWLGFYTVQNPGFSAGATVNISVYPEAATGLASTADSFTAESTTVTKNVTVAAASKTITGTVTYEDTGEAVTTAQVSAWRPGVWNSGNTNSSGVFTMKVSGGSYQVCLGDQYDENGERVQKDWYSNDSCRTVSFDETDATETESLTFVVGRADATVTGVMKNPDGSFPSQGGWVSIWNDDYWFGGNVDSETGVFTVAVVGGNTNTIQATSLFARAVGSTTYKVQYEPFDKTERTYWDASTISVDADATVDLGIITLAERDIVANITVQDEDGNPVSGVYVDAWQENGGWSNAETDENGLATLYVYEGDWNFWPSLWNTQDYVYSGQNYKVSPVSGDTVTHTFVVTATTLTVNVTAKTEQGIIASDIQHGWVNCWDPNSFGGGGYGGSLSNGSGSFGAIGGTYRCNLWIDSQTYMASGEQTVTFTDGTDAVLEFTLLERNATISVNVKDDNNEIATGFKGWAHAFNPDGGWTETRVEGGQATLPVAAGTYFVGVWAEEGSSYITSHGAESPITVEEDGTATKTITVFAVSGTLTATLTDSSGDPVANAWVWCGNWGELENTAKGDFDGGRYIESGAGSGIDGIATVPLVEGHEYECGAGAPPSADLISPAMVEVSLLKKSEAKASFEFLEANATITGTAAIKGSDADIERLWCGAWADEGYNAWSESFDSTYELRVVPGTWHIWCGSDVYADGDLTFYHTQDDANVKVTKEGQIKTKNVTLEESFWSIPESVSVTFDSTQKYTLLLEDGTSVEIPANALASSGNVTVTAEPQPGAIRTSDIPFGIPWNFEAYDADGALISGNFNKSVNLRIPYDPDLLGEFGLTASDLLPKFYNADTGLWETAPNASLDEDNNLLTFTLAHFTQVSLTYNVNGVSNAPSKPRLLKAKKVKKHSARLTWKKPKDSAVAKYQVQLRQCKLAKNTKKACKQKKNYVKQKNWKLVKGIKKQAKRKVKHRDVKKLEQGTFYQYRVRGCNKGDCGQWAKWKRFKTKGVNATTAALKAGE